MIQWMLAIWSLVPLLSKTSLNICKFTVHILLKPGLENFEHYFTSVWDECNCAVVWAFFGIAFLWDWSSKLNSPIPVHFSLLIPKMLMFTLAIYCLHYQFALIHGPNIPGSYAILLFTASDLTSIASHILNWVLFLLWLHPFILSGVISPLISCSILGTYQPGEFIFQCPIFLSFHTVHGILKARILKWFAIPFSSGPHSVRPLHHDPSILDGPIRHGLVS